MSASAQPQPSKDVKKTPASEQKSGSSSPSSVLPPVLSARGPSSSSITSNSPRTTASSVLSSSSLHKSNAELEAASLDWIKPPMSKGLWMTYRDDGLLIKVIRQADVVQGVVRDTFNVSIVSGANTLTCDPCLFKDDKKCIRISPKCADETEEAAVYLSLQHIQQLQLQPMGKIHTKKYGIVNKYSGVKMRLEGSHPSRAPLEHDVYSVPDGFVYELPAVFCSARMVPASPLGIPERQGIIHRELFHDHAIICHKNRLYALPEEDFDDFEEIMDQHPECVVPLEDGFRDDANLLFLRELPEGNKFKGIPYCYIPDQIGVDQLSDTFVYFQTTPKCVHCGKFWATLYCPLCQQHQVQCPQVYCSEACQDKHWRRGHKDFHKSPKTENSVLLLDKKDITATRDYGVRPDPNVPDEGILKRFHDIDINSS